MANLKISQLPEYTGNTSGSFLVMNNSGETTTYKVKKENYVFPFNGNATITGSLAVSGSARITGSLTVSASITSNLIEARNGTSIFDTVNMDNTLNGNYVKGVAFYGYSNMFLYADGGIISLTPSTSNPYVQITTGSLFVSAGNVVVTGSVNISNVLSLKPITPLPSGEPTGSLAVSGSNLFFYNGTWTQIN